ncbi:MAG: UDP-3-O-(3-hydroxymyristoyl)glucosamine N-acyltransferase [Woeseiaceae bacterium]|nr:UDP-3-O-(3-hydroxymyristoyl)glucosamine N-acyltransferase [Woeseiaceae bacterium]
MTAANLGELASRFDCELRGDGDIVVDNVASLASANPRSLSFLSSRAFLPALAETAAGAVVLRAEDANGAPCAVLVSDEPYAAYARMADLICPAPAVEPGIHPSAVIAPSASIAPDAQIAPHVVIGEGSSVGAGAYVGPGSVLGPDCHVGAHSRLVANVTLARKVRLGARGILHPGVVLGADGFGNAMTAAGWVKVPQVGGVVIGDDVEIGANTTIDCGALDDTVIEDGVRIDNLCMIAHNVRVGAHTAMAAMTGIAGSTTIGRRCMFAGQSGAVGHITICDDVVVSGQGMVTKDITEPGVYASSFPAVPVREWNRTVARIRRLDALNDRVRKLEEGDA